MEDLEKLFYRKWKDMKYRCNTSTCSVYERYGGRGIQVSDDWNSYKGFYDDMWESYQNHVNIYGSRQTTLDRIDVNGNYCKENCRWATYSQQNINIRNKTVYSAIDKSNGKEYIFNNMTKFCNQFGFNRSSVYLCLSGKRKSHHGFVFKILEDFEKPENISDSFIIEK